MLKKRSDIWQKKEWEMLINLSWVKNLGVFWRRVVLCRRSESLRAQEVVMWMFPGGLALHQYLAGLLCAMKKRDVSVLISIRCLESKVFWNRKKGQQSHPNIFSFWRSTNAIEGKRIQNNTKQNQWNCIYKMSVQIIQIINNFHSGLNSLQQTGHCGWYGSVAKNISWIKSSSLEKLGHPDDVVICKNIHTRPSSLHQTSPFGWSRSLAKKLL